MQRWLYTLGPANQFVGTLRVGVDPSAVEEVLTQRECQNEGKAFRVED